MAVSRRAVLAGATAMAGALPSVAEIDSRAVANLPYHLWRTDHWFEHEPALRYAIDVLGHDRVMWAIDYPYEEMAPAVQFINSASFNEVERGAFLHGNAERTFALRPQRIERTEGA